MGRSIANMTLKIHNFYQKKKIDQNAKVMVKITKKIIYLKKSNPIPRNKSNVKKTGGWLGDVGSPHSDLDKWYGPNRALFLPGGFLDRKDIPTYLTGELAGDYGYDPLSLGKDTTQVLKYRNAELIHARWAMLAATGIIIPEGLEANGANLYGSTWFETGAQMLNGGTLNYFAVPWGIISNPLPLFAIIVIEIGLMGAVETYRRSGTGPAGYSPGIGKFDSSIFDGLDSIYPGGPFDPLGPADDPDVFSEL